MFMVKGSKSTITSCLIAHLYDCYKFFLLPCKQGGNDVGVLCMSIANLSC